MAHELASEIYHSGTAGPVVRRQRVELLSPGEVVLPDERTNAGDKGSGASHAKGVAHRNDRFVLGQRRGGSEGERSQVHSLGCSEQRNISPVRPGLCIGRFPAIAIDLLETIAKFALTIDAGFSHQHGVHVLTGKRSKSTRITDTHLVDAVIIRDNEVFGDSKTCAEARNGEVKIPG